MVLIQTILTLEEHFSASLITSDKDSGCLRTCRALKCDSDKLTIQSISKGVFNTQICSKSQKKNKKKQYTFAANFPFTVLGEIWMFISQLCRQLNAALLILKDVYQQTSCSLNAIRLHSTLQRGS